MMRGTSSVACICFKAQYIQAKTKYLIIIFQQNQGRNGMD